VEKLMRLVLGDAVHETAVRGSGSAVEADVDGRHFTIALRDAGPATYVLRDGTASHVFHCVRDGDAVHVWWEGEVYRLVEEREGGHTTQRSARGGLEAPMPGKVIKVSVGVGDAVVKGQEILVVEAMKMENAIRATRDGVIKAIAAKVGDMVSPGVVLVEMEEPA
jgi:3-methylcrotonyl-CoA carboxylase alpha subunit